VIEAIDRNKYEVLPVAITKEGKWLSPPEAAGLLPESTRKLLKAGVANENAGDVAILGDPSHKGLVSLARMMAGNPRDPAPCPRCGLSPPARPFW